MNQEMGIALTKSITSFYLQRRLAAIIERFHRHMLKKLAVNGQKVPIIHKLTANHYCKAVAIDYSKNVHFSIL